MPSPPLGLFHTVAFKFNLAFFVVTVLAVLCVYTMLGSCSLAFGFSYVHVLGRLLESESTEILIRIDLS